MPCTCLPEIRTEARTEARFDTSLEAEPFIFDLDAAELLVDQEHKARGWRRCRDCGSRPHPDDMETFFHGEVCCSCAFRRIDKVLQRMGRRHGRRKAWRLLRRLASK